MALTESQARQRLEKYGQQHVLRYYADLTDEQQNAFLAQIETVDFDLMKRLIDTWVLDEPPAESFTEIEPIPVIPRPDWSRHDAREAWDAGENTLRDGRVGLFLVAGGQGTRLGFDGPKGAYPIGPVSKRTLFEFHAEKIHNTQRRYGCVLPWYIMVSESNEQETRTFFRDHGFLGLSEDQIMFCRQKMVPCVDESGAFMLESPGRIAMNPNGHGGCIPAIVETGVRDHARERGIRLFSYFQVDNWAVKVADPFFIGYHVVRRAQMASKNHRKNDPREAVGTHCLCDGEYRVIEYSELDLYPQLLDTDDNGKPVHYAGNSAIHTISADFVESVYARYDSFPWHRAHKKIPCIDGEGNRVEPDQPNGYKFETFVFDALRFIDHEPVSLEIPRAGEYTPIKTYEGPNSVQAAWSTMRAYWAEWLEAAGCDIPRDDEGHVTVEIEISPQFALYKDEFCAKTTGWDWPDPGCDIAIGPDGNWIPGS